MADLTDQQAAQSVKLTGASSAGVEDTYIGNTLDALKSHLKDDLGNSISVSHYGTDRHSLNVKIGQGGQIDGFGRVRTADTDLIESLHFSNSGHSLLINTSVSGSATVTSTTANSSLRLSCTTSSSDSAIAQTKRYFRYNPGRSYIITISGNIGAKKANVRQRFGYFDATNGLFFEQDSSNLKVVVRTDASGSPVDTAVNQSSWNLDKLDGTGLSGVTLDTSKHNLYIIDYLWHGAGRIRFGILYNGTVVYCHEINGANSSTIPFMRTPILPLRVELVNTGTAASDTTFDLVCFAYQKESSDHLSAPYVFSASSGSTSTNLGNTIIPILAIRPKSTFNGLTNRVPVVPSSVSVVTSSQIAYIQVLLNPTLTGASFTSVNSNSVVEYDRSATAVSGGTILKEFYVAASSSLSSSISADILSELDLIALGLDIAGSVQDTLVVAGRSTAGGTNTFAQIEWEEFQ